jgi:hypothetical protein
MGFRCRGIARWFFEGRFDLAAEKTPPPREGRAFVDRLVLVFPFGVVFCVGFGGLAARGVEVVPALERDVQVDTSDVITLVFYFNSDLATKTGTAWHQKPRK